MSAIEEYGSLLQAEPPASEDTSFLIPDGLEDLVQEYLEGLKSEVVEMISLLAASDYERLRILGHNMKGSGASYGFPELTGFGGELETAATRAGAERSLPRRRLQILTTTCHAYANKFRPWRLTNRLRDCVALSPLPAG